MEPAARFSDQDQLSVTNAVICEVLSLLHGPLLVFYRPVMTQGLVHSVGMYANAFC